MWDTIKRAFGMRADRDEFSTDVFDAAETPGSILSEFHRGHRQAVLLATHSSEVLARTGSSHAATVAELAKRLDSQTVNIVFVGIWSSGKSTLINALLGERRLPMDINVESAAIARIVAGDGKRMTVAFNDGRGDSILDQSPENVRDFMSAKSQRRVESEVREVILTSNNRLCAEGAVLVDTPGVEDLNQVRADVTYQFVPQADFVVFLMNAAQAGQLSELSFLSKIVAQGVREICFVVNMIDGKDPSDVQRVLESLRRKVAPILGSPHIFGVSALYALQAKVARVTGEELAAAKKRLPALRGSEGETWDDVLAESGLTQVEEFLASQFAASTRSARMLREGLERTVTYLAAEEARLAMAVQGLVKSRDEIEQTRAELEDLQRNRDAYNQDARDQIARFSADASVALDECLGVHRAEALVIELTQLIQSTGPDTWRSSLGPRTELSILGHLDSFSSRVRDQLREIEGPLQAGLRQAFNDMGRVTAIDVVTSQGPRGSQLDALMAGLAMSEGDKQAGAASAAAWAAAAFGGIAGIITLASAAISGPVFPLVATALGALAGMGHGYQQVSQQERDVAAAGAAMEVRRMFDGARQRCRESISQTRRELESRYIDAVRERHEMLVAECNLSLNAARRELYQTDAAADARRAELKEVQELRTAAIDLIRDLQERSDGGAPTV